MSAKIAVLPTPPRRDPESVLLPRHLEAERSCLGAALVREEAADHLVSHLRPECFFPRAHQHIFEAIRALRVRHQAVDLVLLKDELTRMQRLDECGGPAYIAGLADGLPRSTNVEYYASILRDVAMKRALVMFANRTIDLVSTGEHRSAELLADADRRLLELQGGYTDGRMLSLQATSAARFQSLEWRVAHRGELRGIETGYPSINELTGGWRAGDLVIVAARPSIGKSMMCVNSAVHAARTCRRRDGVVTTAPIRVAIFSLEMRREQLEDRILSQLSGVALSRIQGGHLGDADYAHLSHALEEMHTLRIEIDDRAGQSAGDIRSACRRMQGDGGLDLIIVDYVQLMPGTLERKGANRNEEITDISRRLKDLADEVSAPVLLVSQLRRTDGRPKLEDLRESGSLEQAADVVGLLHRKDHRASGPTEFILAKQRNGPTGTVTLTIDRDIVTFTDGGEAVPEASEDEKKSTQKRTRQRTFAQRYGSS